MSSTQRVGLAVRAVVRVVVFTITGFIVACALWALDQMLHPQAALDAPRWRWDEGRVVAVESRTPQPVIDDLRADVRIEGEPSAFGRGQIIWRRIEQSGTVLCNTGRTWGHDEQSDHSRGAHRKRGN
jgi:gamma-glutamyltranspeptidase